MRLYLEDIGVKHAQHLMEFWTFIDEVRIAAAAVLFFCLCLWCNDVVMIRTGVALCVAHSYISHSLLFVL